MTIYILNWRDIRHPLSGGAEQSLWQHARYWKKKGAKIVWFSSSFAHSKEQETIEDILVIRRGSHYTVHVQALRYFFKKKFSPGDIIIDSFHFLPFFAPLYMRNVKIIALINETARKIWLKNLPFPFSWIGYFFEPFFFLPYKSIPFITASDSAKEDVIKMGINPSHISIIHHGFHPPKKSYIQKKEKKPTVLFLSRLTKDKGVEDAIRAVALVNRQIPFLQFWIGGKPEKESYLSDLKGLIKKLQIKKQTKFLGYVSEREKYQLYSSAWVLVHPSIKEGWGLNVIEANACGTVTVGYSVSGLVDSVKDAKTGLLVGAIDYRNLAQGIIKILRDQTLRATLEKNAKEWANTFSWEKAGRKSWLVITSKSDVY